MKKTMIRFFLTVTPILLMAWLFLAVVYFLLCQSHVVFDSAAIDFRFPGQCWADFGNGYELRWF